MKKILLLMVAALFLCGVTSAQNWGTPDSHAKSSNTPIVAKVTLGETVQEAGTLGAFVGDELRGLATIHTDGNFWIQAFYNEGETNPDKFTFKFYDGQQEYTNCTDTLPGQEEGYGTPNSPQVLNFTTTQTMTQTTAMAEGWTWWSSYIELGDDALTLLENSLGNSGEQILSANGYVNRNEYMGYSYWSGTLSSICNEQMYKIQTNTSCNIAISGQTASLSNHPITINANTWNWIGFPSTQSLSISEAFQGITPVSGDQIKGTSGYAIYETYQSYGWWSGTLEYLNPGQGYMYKSNSSDNQTLYYPTPSRNDNNTASLVVNDFTYEPAQGIYANNMTVTAVVEVNGEEVRSKDYEVAAFVGNQCRGSVKLMYVEPFDRYVAFLLVFGDKEENMRFVLTDGTDESWSDDYLTYTTDAILGTPSEPVTLHFGPLGVNDNVKTMVNVYPNPSDDIFNIEGKDIQKVEVVDNLGQIILSQEIENDRIQINLNKRAKGVYLLRIITNNGITTNRLIKK